MSGCIEATLSHIRENIRMLTLNAESLEQALEAGCLLGRLNWINNDGKLEDEALEVALLKKYNGELLSRSKPESLLGEIDWLHVITNAYDSGGHTPLLKKIVNGLVARGSGQNVVVTGSVTKRFLEDITAMIGLEPIQLNGPLAERASALIRLGRRAKYIVLYIHPNDLGAALAARILRREGHRVLFVNHADHVFSYGPGAADTVLEISGWGWNATKRGRMICSQSFLGIPLEASISRSRPPLNGPVISIGGGDKYKPGNNIVNFPTFLQKLLPLIDQKVELIGPKGTECWWQDLIMQHKGQVQFFGTLPYNETQCRLIAASAYLDSFPITGGTAFPQALVAGKVVFGLREQSGGYSLADMLRYSSVEAMTEALVLYLRTGEEPLMQDFVRTRIRQNFSVKSVVDRLNVAASGGLCLPPKEMMEVTICSNYYSKIWRNTNTVQIDLTKMSSFSRQTRLNLAYKLIDPVYRLKAFKWLRLLRWII